MVVLTDNKPLGQIVYTADEYAFLYSLLTGGGNNIEAIISTEARDQLISLAYREAQVLGASKSVMFTQHEDNEGVFYARLFIDVIVTLEDIGADYHRVRYIRSNNEEYKGLYAILDAKLKEIDNASR